MSGGQGPALPGRGPVDPKAELRARVQAWRRELTWRDVRRWSRAISAHLAEWPVLTQARLVLAYAALRREPQTAEILRVLRERGVSVALPLVIGPVMEAHAAPAEPAGELAAEPPVPLGAIDAVLVPGLAYDPAGRRLGRGGGHYDRFLIRLRRDCLRIGLCFEGQRVDRVPTEPWDQPVDAVVTEAGIWEVTGGGAQR